MILGFLYFWIPYYSLHPAYCTITISFIIVVFRQDLCPVCYGPVQWTIVRHYLTQSDNFSFPPRQNQNNVPLINTEILENCGIVSDVRKCMTSSSGDAVNGQCCAVLVHPDNELMSITTGTRLVFDGSLIGRENSLIVIVTTRLESTFMLKWN